MCGVEGLRFFDFGAEEACSVGVEVEGAVVERGKGAICVGCVGGCKTSGCW